MRVDCLACVKPLRHRGNVDMRRILGALRGHCSSGGAWPSRTRRADADTLFLPGARRRAATAGAGAVRRDAAAVDPAGRVAVVRARRRARRRRAARAGAQLVAAALALAGDAQRLMLSPVSRTECRKSSAGW